MCTVNDEDGKLLMIPKQLLPQSQKICRSCDNVAKVILRRKDMYCKSCFLDSSIHKFRATLGKSKMVKTGDKVLVVFTGNSSSIALIHFLYCGLNEDISKRLMFNVDLLFIDDGLISNTSIQEREAAVEQAKNIAKSFNFKIFVISLSDVFSDVPHVHTHLHVSKHLEDLMENIFNSIKSMTAKKDLLYQLRYKLMLKVAVIKGYDKVFTSDVGTDLAIRLLVGISLGRGDQISAEVGFCDNRILKTPVLRPLKDFTQKEIIYYNIFQEIESMTMVSLKLHFSDVSIQNATEKFVYSLQEKFPSTVYTIFRTGDKLKMGSTCVSNEQRECVLCSKIIKNRSTDTCNEIDISDFSRKTCEVQNNERLFSSNDCSCPDQNGSSEEKNENFLCYGCTLILNDVESKDNLWRYVLHDKIYDRNLANLRSQISEFLIE